MVGKGTARNIVFASGSGFAAESAFRELVAARPANGHVRVAVTVAAKRQEEDYVSGNAKVSLIIRFKIESHVLPFCT